jgi:hypothetical protein
VTVALVPLATDRREHSAGGRPNADFIAHLIAIKEQAPQTRERRRAEPDEAIAAYGARDCRPASTGRVVSRSL